MRTSCWLINLQGEQDLRAQISWMSAGLAADWPEGVTWELGRACHCRRATLDLGDHNLGLLQALAEAGYLGI
jgi:hypothetical protein